MDEERYEEFELAIARYTHSDFPFFVAVALSLPAAYGFTFVLFLQANRLVAQSSDLPLLSIPIGYAFFLAVCLVFAFRSAPTRMSLLKRGIFAAFAPLALPFAFVMYVLITGELQIWATESLAERIAPDAIAYGQKYGILPERPDTLAPPMPR